MAQVYLIPKPVGGQCSVIAASHLVLRFTETTERFPPRGERPVGIEIAIEIGIDQILGRFLFYLIPNPVGGQCSVIAASLFDSDPDFDLDLSLPTTIQ